MPRAREEGRVRALEGRTVVVTRPRARAAEMVGALRDRGARVILAPSVATAPPERPEPLQRALTELEGFDWVVLTSVGGVEAVRRARKDLPAEDRTRRPRRLAVVGPSTASAAEALGWQVDLVPPRYTGDALLEALEREIRPLTGVSVLLLLADLARDVLAERLAARGARVTRVTAYRTVAAGGESVDELLEALEAGEVDLLTFTSPSTAERFLEVAGPAALEIPAAAIGPVTAGAAVELGYRVEVVAEEHTIDGLVAAVERWVLRGEGFP